MHRLPAGTHPLVHEFLGVSPYTAEARSVTGGHSPGWTFVNDGLHPSVAIIGSKGMEGFWLFSREEGTDLGCETRLFAEGEGRRAMAEVGYDFLEVSTSTDACRTALHDALSPWAPEITSCVILRGDRTASPLVTDSPKVVPLLDVLRADISDGVDLQAKIDLFWGSPERFAQAGGMGFCTVVDGCPTSACMSAFVDGDVHCVDMETHELFRRQGHGTATASRFLQACQECGCIMHWSCMEGNVASHSLAHLIGLREVGRYHTYGLEYPSSLSD